MRTCGIDISTCVNRRCQPAEQNQLLDLRDNGLGEHVPPVNSELIHGFAHATFEKLTGAMKVIGSLSQIEEAHDRAGKVPAPTLIGGLWRAAKVNNEIPFQLRGGRWIVVGMQQEDPASSRLIHLATRSQESGVPLSMSRVACLPKTSRRYLVCSPCPGRMEWTLSSLKGCPCFKS